MIQAFLYSALESYQGISLQPPVCSIRSPHTSCGWRD